jgi:glycine/serine hydroxymethyltransferase
METLYNEMVRSGVQYISQIMTNHNIVVDIDTDTEDHIWMSPDRFNTKSVIFCSNDGISKESYYRGCADMDDIQSIVTTLEKLGCTVLGG